MVNSIAVRWAKNLGWRSYTVFYKALAIAILVEEFGKTETAKHIGQSVDYVEKMLGVHDVASQPDIETQPAEWARYLRRVLQVFPMDQLGRRLGKPVAELQAVLDANPE